MKKIKLSAADKALINAFCKWNALKGCWPREYEVSQLIENMNGDHRDLVEDYLSELRLKQYNNELYDL